MANFSGLKLILFKNIFLFRRAKEIDDILTIATQDEEMATVELDPLISWPGCDSKELLELAQKHYDSYSANIQVFKMIFEKKQKF